MSNLALDDGRRAQYLFKLRGNILLEGDLLLARIELAAFLGAAPGEVDDFALLPPQFSPPDLLNGPAALDRHSREKGCKAYRGEGPLALMPELIRSLSFVQHIYCVVPFSPALAGFVGDLQSRVGPVLGFESDGETALIHAVPHYALCEYSAVVARRALRPEEVSGAMDSLVDGLLGRGEDPAPARLAEAALGARSSSGHLSHDIHYYKAKFFPRLARAALNVCARRAGAGAHTALDNFAGSGTTLLEAALLGIPSVGLDIDPLAVLVARTKLDALFLESTALAAEAARVASGLRRPARNGAPGSTEGGMAVEFPRWLLKNRKMTPEIAASLNAEISAVAAAAAGSPPRLRAFLRVLLSDALTRKLRMRFLGTGVGRFSLTLRQAPLAETFLASLQSYAKVAAAIEWLRQNLKIRPAAGLVLHADARAVPAAAGAFDMLLTSPPYLPAASGRESYARARALSLIALGMRDGESVDALDGDSIGSMQGEAGTPELAQRERDLVEWLRLDPLREIKAAPTASYFADMRLALAEMHRVLRPGATAVVVSGRQSTFYRFSTREPLYVAPSAELLADAAGSAGFEVEELLDVQLQKSNMNARPRSLDEYYETLIVMRRP